VLTKEVKVTQTNTLTNNLNIGDYILWQEKV